MSVLAVFGIENDGLNLAVNLLLLFLAVIFLALIYWTWADAKRRIEDPMLVACATAASFFPFVGTVVYLIVRPPEFLDDVRERELEIAAAEARLASLDQMSCQYCGFDVEKAFLRCPSCLRRLKEPCTVCGKPLDPRWKICPYCEAEVGQGSPESRRPRPRRATASPAARPTAARQARQAQAQAQARPPEGEADTPVANGGGDAPAANDRPRTERPARAARERPQ